MPELTLLVDLDGTLVDTRDRHFACYCAVVRQGRGLPLSPGRFWRLKRLKIPFGRLLALSKAALPQERALASWMRLIESPRMLALDRVQPGVRRTLGQWRAQGATIRVVSMRRTESRAWRQLTDLGLAQYIHSASFAGEALGQMPDAQKAALVRPGWRTGRLIWVGDTEEDAWAARAVGADVWLVAGGLRSLGFLRQLGIGTVVRRFADVKVRC